MQGSLVIMGLQRPPTIKEFVIHSILGGRDVADTIVDPEERTTDVDPIPPPPRPSQDSIVFDLMTPPR
jgi:hypothetical protein